MAGHKRNAPSLALTLALAGAAAVLIGFSWKLTFYQDAWLFVLDRQDWTVHTLLAPHNEHLVALQVLVDKIFFVVFGISDNRPEMLFNVFALLACGALVFVWARRRVDPWLALMGAVLLLFFGAAWQTLLWPFEIEFTAPIAAGLGMLLLLEREDSRGDALAAALLIVAFGFGSLGLSFAFAAFAQIVVTHRRRGWRRLYVVFLPAALYLIWYLGWGHEAEHHLTLHNVLLSPPYIFEGVANSVGALAGFGSTGIAAPVNPEWGRPLLVALVGLAIFGQVRRPRPLPALWPLLAAVLSYWLLAGFNFIPGREATSPRYVFAGGLFALLIAAELLRGVHFGRRALLAAAAVTVLALMPNVVQLKDGYEFFKEATVLTRADTGALEIASRTVDPEFTLTQAVAGTSTLESVGAGQFLQVVQDHGSPGYSPHELEATPEPGRHWADIVLSQALPISYETTPGLHATGDAGKPCVTMRAGEAGGREAKLDPGTTYLEVTAGATAVVSLRRFAVGEFPVALTSVEGGTTTKLEVPRDRAETFWFVHLEASQLARLCR